MLFFLSFVDCPYAPWAAYRAEAERRIRTSHRISDFLKTRLQTIAEQPGYWFALMLCGTLPAAVFGDEYNLSHGELVSHIDEGENSRVLSDRKSTLALLGPLLHKWYAERRALEKTLDE